MSCSCGSIGASNGIRLCEIDHRYWLADRELTSVSKVICEVYPTDYSRVDTAVLENARERGVRIDRYLTQYIQTGKVFVDLGERQDVKDRLVMLLDWYDASGLQADAVQKIVHDDTIAGTLDLGVGDMVLDVKCVAKLRPQYALQLGLYSLLGKYRLAGIVHVMKDRVKLVRYNAAGCREDASAAYAWWLTRQRLGK